MGGTGLEIGPGSGIITGCEFYRAATVLRHYEKGNGMIEKLEATDAMRREVNHSLMVQWINHDLLGRADNDVRTSTVLYDADRMFLAAVPGRIGTAFLSAEDSGWAGAGVRFYSHGIV